LRKEEEEEEEEEEWEALLFDLRWVGGCC